MLGEVWSPNLDGLPNVELYGRIWTCRLLAFSSIPKAVIAISLVSVFWSRVSHQHLVAWALAALLIHLALAMTSSSIHVGLASGAITARYGALHFGILVLEALSWSSLSWVVRAGGGDGVAELIGVIVAMAASSANLVVQSPARRSFYTYEFAIAVPIATLLVSSSDPSIRSMSSIAVGYSLISMLLQGRVHAVMVRTMELNMRHARTVQELGDANQQLSLQADHDSLTGIANRRGLFEALEKLGPDQAAVAFFDLDRFKLVNDSLGHFAGDQLLQTVADRMASLVAPGDVLGRLGGDEFVMIFDLTRIEPERRTRVDYVVRRCEAIRQALAEPVMISGKSFSVSSSAGVAIGSRNSDDGTTLLRHADTALHRAKDSGRDRVEVFDDSVRERLVRQMDDEEVVRQALRNGAIVPWYQPIINASNRRMVSAEVLARWITPEGNTITAEQFISIAAESGQLERLAEVITERTLADLRSIDSFLPSGFRVAINLPPRYVSQSGRIHRLTSLLRSAPHGLLTVEVTERSSPEDLNLAAERLQALRDFGIKVVLDDFGTGHGSLALLQRLPLDGVKIDRSFVSSITTNHRDRALVRGLLTMSQELGLSVVAEGVETQEQSDELMRLGCTSQQGYLFSGATDVVGLQDLLVRMPPDTSMSDAVATPQLRRR